jgi:hypothetical protein
MDSQAHLALTMAPHCRAANQAAITMTEKLVRTPMAGRVGSLKIQGQVQPFTSVAAIDKLPGLDELSLRQA